MFEVNQNVLGDAQPCGTPTPLVMTIKTGRGSVSSVSSAPSPAIRHKGKDMETMLQLAKQEKEEARLAKAAMKKQTAKAEKRKAATPSSPVPVAVLQPVQVKSTNRQRKSRERRKVKRQRKKPQ